MNGSTPSALPFTDDASARQDLYTNVAMVAAMLGVITLTLVLFIISQYYLVKNRGWEIRILYPLSYLHMLSGTILVILIMIYGGAGTLTEPDDSPLLLKLESGAELLYVGCVTFPKLCLLVLYLRIFKVGTAPHVRLATWIVLGTVVVYWLIICFIIWPTGCQPFAFGWDKTIQGGHCRDYISEHRYVGLPNILTDFAILVIPIAPLYQLQMGRLRKFGLMVTVLAGSLGIVFSILRLAVLVSTPADGLTYSWMTKENTYAGLEVTSYFICSCLPGMRPLIGRAYDKISRMSLASNMADRWFLPWTAKRRAAERGREDLFSDTTYACQIVSGPVKPGAKRHSNMAGTESGTLHTGTDPSFIIQMEDTVAIDFESSSGATSVKDLPTSLQLAHYSDFGRGLHVEYHG